MGNELGGGGGGGERPVLLVALFDDDGVEVDRGLRGTLFDDDGDDAGVVVAVLPPRVRPSSCSG